MIITLVKIPAQHSRSWLSCVVGMTVAVGVGVGTGAGVIMGLMLALGVDLFPGMACGLLGAAASGVGFMLAVGGSEVLALWKQKCREVWLLAIFEFARQWLQANCVGECVAPPSKNTVPSSFCHWCGLQRDLSLFCCPLRFLGLKIEEHLDKQTFKLVQL